jgi:hypothetical protein
MITRATERRLSYIDVEVLQRLLKVIDAIVLGLGALAITFGTVHFPSLAALTRLSAFSHSSWCCSACWSRAASASMRSPA